MIAERISELMGNASLTTADLAKLVGVERPSVSRWINGRARPKPEYLEKLAGIFGVSVAFISGHEPVPRVNPGRLLEALSAARVARDELDKVIRALESARGADVIDLRGASYTGPVELIAAEGGASKRGDKDCKAKRAEDLLREDEDGADLEDGGDDGSETPDGSSAHVEQAEEFQEMIKAARQKKFDVLVLHKLDRFGRDRETTVMYKAMLRRHGVKIFSLTEKLGESAYERMVEGFLEVIAEFYSLNLGQETRKGQRAATRAGRWTGGKPPYGYQRGEDENGKAILIEDPTEAAVIRGVYERYVEGQARNDIQDWIKEQTGKRWSAQTLLSRLSNPTYKGVLRYGVTSLSAKGKRTKKAAEELVTGACHAIIPEELWERAQKLRESHQTRNRRPSYPYLMTKGFMVCAECGTAVIGQYGGGKGYRYPYYVCPGWAKGTCERQNSVRADIVDEEAVTMILEIAKKFQLQKWTQIKTAIDSEKERLLRAREQALRGSLETIREKKENLLEFVMASGAKQVGTVTRKLRDLEAEEEAAAERLVQLQMEEAPKIQRELDLIEDWMTGLIPYLKENPGSPTWTKAVRGMFGAFWDFQAGSGGLYLLPLFPDGQETLLQAIEPAEGSPDGEVPRLRTIRSARNGSLTGFWRITIPKTRYKYPRRTAQFKGEDPLVR